MKKHTEIKLFPTGKKMRGREGEKERGRKREGREGREEGRESCYNERNLSGREREILHSQLVFFINSIYF